ncbi:hypothetical protein QQS21_001343 [Conoideocrella luteorostrata]|uniref:PH domain-containing protein n=1 Tax=Conoideocrella luteorostrata TaxID=1105319 RepID=A0AAJ0CX24_9HYPO|nr:hypothetical protein QQS21_001343 [Conoideocrella luteorostrata]
MTNEPMLEEAEGFATNSSLRGPRGPGIDFAAELENRMPIRQDKLEKIDKLGRRDSRLGLRNIFGRSKTGKDIQSFNHASSTFKSAGLRTDQSPKRGQLDPSLPTNFSWKPLPATAEDSEAENSPQRHAATSTRKKGAASKSGRQHKDSSLSWSMPPLFKAFPQAVRHAILPAPLLSADAILRLNEKKSSLQAKEEEGAAAGIGAGLGDDHLADDNKEKPKKKNRRNATATIADFEWTTKIYVLVTSGYLLQYTGEGNFDRLPEKILRLGPSSAAFATDAIPGRHWVVQISSVADVVDTQGVESRSIFSKLSFRMAERRHAANLFMVFENAMDMEGWMTVLRTEIEKQGGKKKLPETGTPRTERAEGHLRDQTSQRTLIVRDPSRFTSPRGRTSHSTLSQHRIIGHSETSSRVTSSDTNRNLSLDDISTTNSIVSQDERQLDSLRENQNRLSFISSGQRTFVTSTGSSPEGSPTNDKFDEAAISLHEDVRADVRPRPNASEISTRRESMQSIAPFLDDNTSPSKNKIRIMPVGVTATHGDRVMSPVGVIPTPNFSVPHASARRFSYVKRPGSRTDISPRGRRDDGSSPRRMSRIPPTTMQSAHRLSVVTDQSVTRAIATERLPTAPASPPTSPTAEDRKRRWRSVSRGRAKDRCNDPLPELPHAPQDPKSELVHCRISPRKHASTSALRRESPSSSSPPPPPPPPRTDGVANKRPHIASLLAANSQALEEPRGHRTSFLDIGGTDNNKGGLSIDPFHDAKRASTCSILSERSIRSYDVHGSTVSSNNSSDSSATVTSSSQPGCGHYLNVEKTPRSSLLNRRSMPHIAVSGPPLAPPPTRALPPIPQKVQTRS